jgi:asparagine synthase (glutamine-hydrolysing)
VPLTSNKKAEVLRPKVLEIKYSSSWTRLENFSNEKPFYLMSVWLLLIQLRENNLFSEDKQFILAANGEIYNHRDCVNNLKGNTISNRK